MNIMREKAAGAYRPLELDEGSAPGGPDLGLRALLDGLYHPVAGIQGAGSPRAPLTIRGA